MTRDEVITEARTWLGTPWRHQACAKGAGVDCLHFIAGVARELGSADAERFFATPEWHSYGRHPDPAMMFAGCDALLDRISISDALPADILVLTCGRHPMHFGLLTAADMMVHAWLGAGRVLEQRIDAKWRARIIRAYRLRGIV